MRCVLLCHTLQVWGIILGEYFDNITGGADTYNVLRSEVRVDCCCL